MLHDDIPRHRALKEIYTRSTRSELSYEHVYSLFIKAYNNEDQAEKAACEFVLQKMRQEHANRQ